MVELLNRLGTPEFWLSVIIGPIVAALVTEQLKGKTPKQWIKGLTFATAAIALISAIAVVVAEGYSIKSFPTLAYSLFLYWIAWKAKPNIRIFVVAAINVPIIILLAAAVYHAGVEATSKSMIIFAYLYMLMSVVVSLVGIAWMAGTRKDNAEPQ